MKYHVYNREVNKLKDKLWPCKLEKQYIRVTFTVNDTTEVLTENNILNYGCIPVDQSGIPIKEPKKAKDRVKTDANQPCYKLTLDFKKSPQIIIAIANNEIQFFEKSKNEFGITWNSLSNEHKELKIEVITIEKGEF